MALWTAADFQSEFNCSHLDVTLVLADAEYEVENYITAAAYADAIKETPDDARAAAKIIRVTGYLAYFYLQQQKLVGGERTKHTEQYAGVKSYSDSYDTEAAGRVFTSEADILLELWEWKQAVTSSFDPIVATASGRWVGVTSTETEDEW